MTYTPFRLMCEDALPPAKAANPAKAGPALATLATLAGLDDHAAFSTTSVADDFAERAAIIEEGAKVPRAWAEGFAALQAFPVPRGVDARTWLAMIDAAGRFLDQWGGKTAALGWTAGDLFGLDPDAPMNRRDRRGAALFLIDAEIVAVTADAITIRKGGSVQTIYRRAGLPGPAWEQPQ